MLRSAIPAPRVTMTMIALLLLALAGGGCSTVSVHTQAAPGVDFASFHTFAQAPAPKSAGMDLPGYSEIAGDHIQAAIAHELEAKGLSPAPAAEADLIVAFSIDGQQRQDIESTGGIGWYEGWGGDTYTVDYTRGTLVVDVFDAKKKKLVWHAYGQTDLYGSDDHTRQVDSAVQSILEKFPPTP